MLFSLFYIYIKNLIDYCVSSQYSSCYCTLIITWLGSIMLPSIADIMISLCYKISLYSFFIFQCLVNSALYTCPEPVPYEYGITRSNICSLLSSFALRTILFTFSVNTLCKLLLNLCCDLNITLLLDNFCSSQILLII